MALMLAPDSPELDVRAVTVVPGNVVAAQGLDNALRMISLANRCDIPVAAGAEHPLFQKRITAQFWHGKNGLANIQLPLAVGVAIDSTLVERSAIDVETRAEFTRGETVANRHGYVERNLPHGDHFIIEGVDRVSPNAKVCVNVDAPRFFELFVSRIQSR